MKIFNYWATYWLLCALVLTSCAKPQELFQPDAAIVDGMGDGAHGDAAADAQIVLRPVRSEHSDMKRPGPPHRELDGRNLDGSTDSK